MVSGTGSAPNQTDTVAFWRGLWSEPVNHSEDPWTEVVAGQCASITPMDPVIITPDDVAEVVRRAPYWKSPGLDGLHHYWLKGFMVCHAVLARQFQEALNQKSLPSLFTTGIIHLVPKDQQRHLDMVLEVKQNERIMLQAEYDRQITALRIIRALADNTEEIDSNAPLYEELRTMIDKMEMMRRLLLKFLMVRSASHDWLAAPHQRYAALKLAREANTVEGFVRDHNSDLDD
ncbi:unnamed protein product [Parnassius apollo]|uniref:(apollo) hypothetical protein n=1 Tax=Parnassius apollo TaxID=110799 RepID=A0A8S3XVU4_PARAO|nr:unnamed protein product [Parnassius apollo]